MPGGGEIRGVLLVTGMETKRRISARGISNGGIDISENNSFLCFTVLTYKCHSLDLTGISRAYAAPHKCQYS